ncbi:MAG TPA: porin [Alphaproteobacteria bacterium]|nr:porin [Alphaproteobacteria bacterium]
MKRVLLGSTALLGAGLVAQPALAADGVKLAVGGFFKEAYQFVIDDDHEGELGKDQATDGFFNDAEIHFTGSTTLDNGLEVGARVELEGEEDFDGEAGDQIDEAWVWFSGGFGEVRIGSDDDALANSCVVPPGGTGNFSAFSPNQWGANSGGAFFFGGSSNSICTGVDAAGDAQKLIYITPNFSGFQLTVSYTPNETVENHTNGGGPHVGMPGHGLGQSRHNFSVYGTYNYEGDGWGLTAGLGGSFEGHVEESSFVPRNVAEQDFYQAGINLTFGNFAIGVAGEYYNDLAGQFEKSSDAFFKADSWVAGIGASYTMDAWTFGAQYSHREDDIEAELFYPSEDVDFSQDRAVLTALYRLGPGIQVDGEIAYTWNGSDPNDFANVFIPDTISSYDAVEFGIGTSITF